MEHQVDVLEYQSVSSIHDWARSRLSWLIQWYSTNLACFQILEEQEQGFVK
jgi:hypothetical protein